jgi:hypothetical protein
MNISGVNQPEPCYGIGSAALVARWIERKQAQSAAGMSRAAEQTGMMRRELQEATWLVADPSRLIGRHGERYRRALTARRSDLFHGFEWLRGEALKGNRHAATMLREVCRLNRASKAQP